MVASRDHLTDEGSIPQLTLGTRRIRRFLVEIDRFCGPRCRSRYVAHQARETPPRSRTDVNRSPLRNRTSRTGSELPGYGAHVDEQEESRWP